MTHLGTLYALVAWIAPDFIGSIVTPPAFTTLEACKEAAAAYVASIDVPAFAACLPFI